MTRIDGLTPREYDVLVLVAEGLTDDEIGARLGISQNTVRIHMGNLLSKLDMPSRTTAAVWWVRHEDTAVRVATGQLHLWHASALLRCTP